jgi:hypothetical protein
MDQMSATRNRRFRLTSICKVSLAAASVFQLSLGATGALAAAVLPFVTNDSLGALDASSNVVFNTFDGTYTINNVTYGGGLLVEAGQNTSNYDAQYMVYNFSNVVIQPGVQVTVDQNQPLIILGNNITVDGTIDVSGGTGGNGLVGQGLSALSRAGGGGGGGGGVVGIFATNDVTIGSTASILATGGSGGIGGTVSDNTGTGGTGGLAVAGGGPGASGASPGGGGNGGVGGTGAAIGATIGSWTLGIRAGGGGGGGGGAYGPNPAPSGLGGSGGAFGGAAGFNGTPGAPRALVAGGAGGSAFSITGTKGKGGSAGGPGCVPPAGPGGSGGVIISGAVGGGGGGGGGTNGCNGNIGGAGGALGGGGGGGGGGGDCWWAPCTVGLGAAGGAGGGGGVAGGNGTNGGQLSLPPSPAKPNNAGGAGGGGAITIGSGGQTILVASGALFNAMGGLGLTTSGGSGVVDFLGDYQIPDLAGQVLGNFYSDPAGIATGDFYAIGGGSGAGAGSDGVQFPNGPLVAVGDTVGIAEGGSGVSTFTVSNDGGDATITAINVVQDSTQGDAGDFADMAGSLGGTCAVGDIFAAGTTCTVAVNFVTDAPDLSPLFDTGTTPFDLTFSVDDGRDATATQFVIVYDPEPGSLAVLASGLTFLALLRTAVTRRRSSARCGGMSCRQPSL